MSGERFLDESYSAGEAPRRGRWWRSPARRQAVARGALLALAAAAVVAGLQAGIFFWRYEAQLAAANDLLYDLQVENTQDRLYLGIDAALEGLAEAAGEELAAEMRADWQEFDAHFGAAPREAIETLRERLPVYAAGIDGAAAGIARLRRDLERLQSLHSDPYAGLLDDLADPPLALWPSAAVLARYGDYRDTAALNRALFLAQLGEYGTARVILTGLHAAAEDPTRLALIYYTLGRLQFELLRSRPEAEYYLQAVEYLRQSLAADPDLEIAKRLLDYLLSLSEGETVPRAGEGRPTTPSEGEGAAVSADRRLF